MSSQSHSVISSPVRYTIQITTNQLVRPPVQTRPCVLVIDPDQVFLQLISHALAHDYQVLTAHDAVEAAKLLRRGHFELLLLDLSMPLCNGVDVLQRVRRHPRLREIPLLVLCTSAGLRRHLLDMDVVGVVPKVRWLEDLSHTIGETLRLAAESAPEVRPDGPAHAARSAHKDNTRLSTVAAQ